MSKLDDLLVVLAEADPKRDEGFQKKAEALAKKVVAFLKSKRAPEDLMYTSTANWLGGHEALTIGMWEIDPKYKDMDLSLLKNDVGSFRGSMGPGNFGSKTRYHLILYSLPSEGSVQDYARTYQEKPDSRFGAMMAVPPKAKLPVPDWIHDVVVHEVVHYFDFIRGEEGFAKAVKSGELHARGDKVGYFNTPEEFNAYYQAGANLVTLKVKELVAALTRGNEKWLGMAIQFADHAAFVNWASTQAFWPWNWIEAMEEGYRRKFKARLFQLFGMLRERVVAAYEKGFNASFKELSGFMTASHRQNYRQSGGHREWPVSGLPARKSRYTNVDAPDLRLFIPRGEATERFDALLEAVAGRALAEDEGVDFFRGFTAKLDYLRDPGLRQRIIVRVVKGSEERDAVEAFLSAATASEEPAGSIRLAFRVKRLIGAYEKAARKRYSRGDEVEAGQRARKDLEAVKLAAKRESGGMIGRGGETVARGGH